jgi:indolepyruvate ferredoxin oxidoreductase beta subunit
VSLEATEAIRTLMDYGNRKIKVICNTRPIHPVGVIAGEISYPSAQDIKKWMEELTEKTWFIDATDEAIKLGSPVFGNIILIGALSGINVLPLDRGDFEKVISETMSPEKVEINLRAYDLGASMISGRKP